MNAAVVRTAACFVLIASHIAGAQEPPHATAPGQGNLGLSMATPQSIAAVNQLLAGFDKSPDLVVAEIGKRTVTWGDVADAIRDMPPIATTIPFAQLYKNAVDRMVENKSMAAMGEKLHLDQDPTTKRRMLRAPDDILASAFLSHAIAPNITEARLREIFNAQVANHPGPDEVRARIIMLEREDEANYISQKLNGGGDFADLAREFSKDGTASNGGDLGYVRRDQLAPEIGLLAFTLAPGQITAYPVKSGDFWFIIRVEGRIHEPAPTFEEAKDGLTQDVMHAVVGPLRSMAVESASVVYHDIPLPAAPPPAKP